MRAYDHRGDSEERKKGIGDLLRGLDKKSYHKEKHNSWCLQVASYNL
jgi:hypothetical protein